MPRDRAAVENLSYVDVETESGVTPWKTRIVSLVKYKGLLTRRMVVPISRRLSGGRHNSSGMASAVARVVVGL